MSKVVYVGADPEIFMFKEGKPVSAHNAIPGNKKDPHKVKDGAVQVDGLALEFNIEPAKTAAEFSQYIESVMSQLKLMVPDYELVAVPVAEFGKEYLSTQPKEALELGCEPDYNAYTGLPNPRPDGEVDFRTGAGHIHIGWNHIMGIDAFDPLHPEHMEACCTIVKQLDFALGFSSLLWDKDQKRRTLYGGVGAFRPKPYGVEYRTLSNAWLNNKKIQEWIFETVQLVFNRLVKGNRVNEGHLAQTNNWFKKGDHMYVGDYINHYFGNAHKQKLFNAVK